MGHVDGIGRGTSGRDVKMRDQTKGKRKALSAPTLKKYIYLLLHKAFGCIIQSELLLVTL